MQILNILTLNNMTLTLTQGHMVLTKYCPHPCSVILKKNELNIYPYTRAVVRNDKSYIFMTLTFKMYPLIPKSIAFVFDLYPTIVHNTNSPGHSMSGMVGDSTHTQLLLLWANNYNYHLPAIKGHHNA